MIDQIDIGGILAVEPEYDPPVGPHGDSPEAVPLALQGMQAKTRF
jgi:hypothetical protein